MRVDLYLIKLPNTSEHSSSCCDALLYCSTCLAEIGCSTTSSVTTCQMQVEEEIVVSLIRRTRLHEINQNGPALPTEPVQGNRIDKPVAASRIVGTSGYL